MFTKIVQFIFVNKIGLCHLKLALHFEICGFVWSSQNILCGILCSALGANNTCATSSIAMTVVPFHPSSSQGCIVEPWVMQHAWFDCIQCDLWCAKALQERMAMVTAHELSSTMALSSFPGCSKAAGPSSNEKLFVGTFGQSWPWGSALGTHRQQAFCSPEVKASLDWSTRGMSGSFGLTTTQSNGVLWMKTLICGSGLTQCSLEKMTLVWDSWHWDAFSLPRKWLVASCCLSTWSKPMWQWTGSQVSSQKNDKAGKYQN